jgi:hypothetical protein
MASCARLGRASCAAERASCAARSAASCSRGEAARVLRSFLRLQLPSMARVAGNPAKNGFALRRRVIGEELQVECLGHLDHLARFDFSRVVVAGEVPFWQVAAAARHSERLYEVLHFLFELRDGQSRQHFDGRAFHLVWRGRVLGCQPDRKGCDRQEGPKEARQNESHTRLGRARE